MDAWTDCGDGFIRADVIRWTEAVFDGPFARNGRKARRGKAVRVGEREVIAEVLSPADSKGFIRLLVRACRVVSARGDVPVAPKALEVGGEIRRQEKPLLRNGIQRLAWSGESARAAIIGKALP
jgi:hypothetical protein